MLTGFMNFWDSLSSSIKTIVKWIAISLFSVLATIFFVGIKNHDPVMIYVSLGIFVLIILLILYIPFALLKLGIISYINSKKKKDNSETGTGTIKVEKKEHELPGWIQTLQKLWKSGLGWKIGILIPTILVLTFMSWLFIPQSFWLASRTVQKSIYKVSDSWSENKKEHDIANGNHIPDTTSGKVVKTETDNETLYTFTINKGCKTESFEVPKDAKYRFLLPTKVDVSNGDLVEKLEPGDEKSPDLLPGFWKLSAEEYFHNHPSEEKISGWIKFITKK